MDRSVWRDCNDTLGVWSMSRVIKFRAWDAMSNHGKGVMLSWEQIKRYTLECTDDPDTHLMQFTGLHDKNGREIYEGDVMRWGADDGAIAEVIYSGDKFMLHQLGPARLAVGAHMWEVIGSICENPELLTKSV